MGLYPKPKIKKPQSFEKVLPYSRFIDSNNLNNEVLNVYNTYDTKIYKSIYEVDTFDFVVGNNAGQVSLGTNIPVNAIVTNISFHLLMGGGLGLAPTNMPFFTSIVFDIRNGGNLKYQCGTALDHLGGFTTGVIAIPVYATDGVVVTWSYTGVNANAVPAPVEYYLLVSYIEL